MIWEAIHGLFAFIGLGFCIGLVIVIPLVMIRLALKTLAAKEG